MQSTRNCVLLLVLLFLTSSLSELKACSMYKITANGKTMVGCNHDAWLTTPKVWFKNANQHNFYGAGFTGAREISEHKTAPQSGMNTAGLAFSRLASYHSMQENPFPNRLKISDEVDYLTNILHECATVAEVKNYIAHYDHSIFLQSVFIYVDSLGDYLIVEPYQMLEGNDSNYVLANFCPSITGPGHARKMDRYRNGEDFLKVHHALPSLAYCTALSDTLHVCRNKKGDGTLITSIWDTKQKSVHLYFYHTYDSAVKFSLTEELAKGDHILNVPELFPKNSEFEELVNYCTPSNTVELRISLVISAGLLIFFSLVMGISKIWKRQPLAISFQFVWAMPVINVLLVIYLFILATNKNIFYFDAPYKDPSSIWVSALSYLPLVLFVSMVPFIFRTFKLLKSDEAKLWTKATLVSNLLVYAILMVGFAYWGLYDI